MSKFTETWTGLKERARNNFDTIAFGIGTVAAFGVAFTHPVQEAAYQASTVIEQVNGDVATYESQALDNACEWTATHVIDPVINYLLPNPLDSNQG
ncbi:MAG TPA: hypothetical protein VGO07_04805 [Candidatus Saccharimonadales bacterium]|jgi:hypothetical protein|nr:hypothetical protein [Candidatus Saccharimonadales bacterium]